MPGSSRHQHHGPGGDGPGPRGGRGGRGVAGAPQCGREWVAQFRLWKETGHNRPAAYIQRNNRRLFLASEAYAASKQPQRSNLTSDLKSVTSITYLSMYILLIRFGPFCEL